MSQGTWLGLLIFISLLNDLSTDCMLHKYVDDSTLSDFLNKGDPIALWISTLTWLLNGLKSIS